MTSVTRKSTGRVLRLAFAFCATIGMLTAAGVAARPLDDVLAAKSLRVIVYLDNAPFSWDDNGQAKGIDVELGRALARELGVDAEIVLRMHGENQDDDLRANVWRGPLTGGGIGDVMLHVPVDREFAARNLEAVIGNPYFQERVAVAIHPELTGDVKSFDVFKDKKIGVKIGTVSDYFLMTFDNGALIDKISHHVKADLGAKEFLAKETTALMGVRSNIEGLLSASGHKPVFVEPPMDGIYRSKWVVGMAWRENSRDLGYALQAALEKITASGELKRIFDAHKVTYAEPPLD